MDWEIYFKERLNKRVKWRKKQKVELCGINLIVKK